MSEDENVSVIEEVAAPSEAEVQTERQEEAPQNRQRNEAEYNWAEARRKRDELERQNDELRYEMKKLKSPKKNDDEDDLSKLSDDDIVTVSHAKKLAMKVAKETAQEAIRQRDSEMVEERLSLKYSDFNDVVSQENIDLLKQLEPDLANSLSLHTDPFILGINAYKLIKRVVGDKKPMAIPPEKKKAEVNLAKPASINSAPKATSPLGNAHLFENGLTPELKNQLWAEMEQIKKHS